MASPKKSTTRSQNPDLARGAGWLRVTPADHSLLMAALHDHVLALESNARRAARGHAIAVDQEDMASAAVFAEAQAKVRLRINMVRALRKRVSA